MLHLRQLPDYLLEKLTFFLSDSFFSFSSLFLSTACPQKTENQGLCSELVVTTEQMFSLSGFVVLTCLNQVQQAVGVFLFSSKQRATDPAV